MNARRARTGYSDLISNHAKRRLLLEGPLLPGSTNAHLATIAVAAELRLQGLDQEAALDAVRQMPLTATSTRLHRLRKNQANAVQFAYHPPNKDTIFSGCCRDTRPRTGNRTTSSLRDQFAGYCDETCEATCPMLRAIRSPERALWNTPYECVVRSNLWVHGGGLGVAGRDVYCIVAGLAVAQGTPEFRASSRYITMKLDGLYNARHIRHVLREFVKHGLVTLVDKRTGLRRVPTPTAEWVADLEARLGVAGRRAERVAEAARESAAYQDWVAEVFSRHNDLDAALAAWDPPA